MQSSVIVVGGGPCGLMTALLLARQGVRSVLFEKHPGLSYHPKAMGITRRTNEIFRQLGLEETLLREAPHADYRNVSLWLASLEGEEYARAALERDTADFSPCERLHCPQPIVEGILREALASEPLAELRFGTHVDAVEPAGDGVRVRFSSDEGSGEMEALWLVAADGAGSPIREQLGIETAGPGDRGHFLNVYFRAPYGKYLEGRLPVLFNVLREDIFAPFVSVNGHDEFLMHLFLEGDAKVEDFTEEKLREIIQYASGVPQEPVEILSVSPWVMSPKLAKNWRKGRIFLTGDASARVSPAGGLGMNNGLQSVHNLAWKLAAVVHDQASEALLDSYESERLPAARFTFENSEGNADEIFAIVGAALTGHMDQARTLMTNSRRRGSGYGQDFGLTYPQGAFVPDGPAPEPADPINDFQPSGNPGRRAPHLPLKHGGSLLDYLGGQFVLLAKDPSWESSAQALPDSFLPLKTHLVSALPREAEMFSEVYDISDAGAVLVRPDGIIAARWQSSGSAAELEGTLKAILAK